MSKKSISLELVLYLLRRALSLVVSASKFIDTIRDVIDDGVVNSSVERPEWVVNLEKSLENINNVIEQINSIGDNVSRDFSNNAE